MLQRAAAAALLTGTGCTPLPLPSDNGSCSFPFDGVNWIPDVAHPVGWGEEHVTSADGAPRTMTIYYPSSRIIPPTPILRLCSWPLPQRWPVAILLHGMPPAGVTLNPSDAYNRRFFRLAIALARSGFVVIAPLHSAHLPTPEIAPEMIAAAQRDVEWLRTGWHWSKWVAPTGTKIAVMGHSYGAIQAARIAIGWPEVGALAALSGPFTEPNDAPQIFKSIKCPSFFMFGHLNFEEIESDTESPSNLWRTITADRYAAIFNGQHFDYLEPSQSGTAPRGACSQIGELAAELSALFIGRVLRQITPIDVNLKKPQVTLTDAQQLLGVAYMRALEYPWGDACRIKLKWKVHESSGSRWVG